MNVRLIMGAGLPGQVGRPAQTAGKRLPGVDGPQTPFGWMYAGAPGEKATVLSR